MARGRHPTRIHIDPPDEQITAKYLYQWYGRDLHHEPHRFPGLTSPDLFSNNHPLEIDFGCGNGLLACNRAKQYPESNLLGIDQSQKPLFCAIRTAVTFNLANIRFLRGNYNEMIPLLRPQTIRTAFFLFPNPPQNYHKERANRQRRYFLENLYKALIPGGRFYFATDAPAFFACMFGLVKNDLNLATLDIKISDNDFITHYCQIWQKKNREAWSFVVEKESMATPRITDEVITSKLTSTSQF